MKHNSRPAEGRPRPKVTITARAYRLQHDFYTLLQKWKELDSVYHKSTIAAQNLHFVTIVEGARF